MAAHPAAWRYRSAASGLMFGWFSSRRACLFLMAWNRKASILMPSGRLLGRVGSRNLCPALSKCFLTFSRMLFAGMGLVWSESLGNSTILCRSCCSSSSTPWGGQYILMSTSAVAEMASKRASLSQVTMLGLFLCVLAEPLSFMRNILKTQDRWGLEAPSVRDSASCITEKQGGL